MEVLSRSLFEPQFVRQLVKYFQAVIPPAVSLALKMDFSHLCKCLMLANIIPLHPDIIRYLHIQYILYIFLQNNVFFFVLQYFLVALLDSL